MSLDTLLIILLGGMVGGGVVLLVHAIRGSESGAGDVVRGSRRSIVERVGRQAVLGVIAGVVTLAITLWPVAGIAAGLLVTFWPVLFGGGKVERESIERLEGLAAWTESLRDTIAGAVGLEQAIPATVYAASPAIQPHLRLLSDRLRVRTPMAVALQGFADELDDASADLIVAALILNSKLRGPGLRQVLSSLSEAARAELDMRQRVFAQRASTRRSVQIVAGVSVAFIVGLAVFNRGYVEPYFSPEGQLVLVLVFAIFAAGFVWMKRLSGVEAPDRFLATTGDRAVTERVGR